MKEQTESAPSYLDSKESKKHSKRPKSNLEITPTSQTQKQSRQNQPRQAQQPPPPKSQSSRAPGSNGEAAPLTNDAPVAANQKQQLT